MESAEVVAGTNAVAEDHNKLQRDVVLGKKKTGVDADAATITVDLSDKTKGNVRTITLEGNRTIAFSNPTVGQAFILRMIQDATGSRVPTWPATIKWPSATAPALTTTGNRIDVFGFVCTVAGGSPEYDGYFLGFDLATP